MEQIHKYYTEEFKLGKGRLKNFDWKESSEIEANHKEYPLILTTSRVLQHYNAATMTRRTNNINIVDEDVLLIHPKDCLLYTSPSPRDISGSRMPSSA